MTIIPPLGPDGRWHYRRSLASRVTLLTTIAVGITVAFVALGAYVTVRMQLQATTDDSLVQRAKSASAEDLCRSGNTPVAFLRAANVWVACFASSSPFGVASELNVPFQLGEPEAEVWKGEDRESIRTVVGTDRSHWRIVAVHHDTGETIVLAQALEAQQSVLRKLGIVMSFFGLAGVISAAMAGWMVARNGLRPVRRLTAAVEEIARTEDLTPLPVEGDDEVARLATAFNQMLTALAASRERQRQLVADAGHELRTPLTSLRTNIDLLAQTYASGATISPEARAELLGDVRAQTEELTTLIGDLMELSRDEPLTHVVESVELPEIVERAVARVRRRAPDVTFEVETRPWYVIGESGAIERAVTNLLDNAAKWSPAGGTVWVRLADGVLTVDDEGPGIDPEDRPHVFDRFYRATESRSMPGSGLGLAIVRQTAVRHSGGVSAEESPYGGARLTFSLPGSPLPVPDWTPA